MKRFTCTSGLDEKQAVQMNQPRMLINMQALCDRHMRICREFDRFHKMCIYNFGCKY